MRLFLLSALAVISLVANSVGAAERLPAGHDREGLPATLTPYAAYATDPAHPLNRLHRLLFLTRRVPTEIGAALPAERRRAGLPDREFFNGKWALQNRKQVNPEQDEAEFGGDVRTSPVERWTETDAAEARTLLALIATSDAAAQQLPSPLARLSLQWDLLQVWWRFERSNNLDEATLIALAKAIRALGQSRAALTALPSGLKDWKGAETRDRRQARVPPNLDRGEAAGWVEVDRVSQSLFQAQRSLVSARVFLRGEDQAALVTMIGRVAPLAAQNQLVEVPRGTETALVLAMVGLTPELEAVATPVVSEVRVRLAVADDRLEPEGDTSTKDGWNNWVWLFSREQMTAGAAQPLRFVPDTAQSLFLEYGTPKHTTYFAQCALCHRSTNAGNQNPSGVHALGRYAKPSVLRDPAKRGRDAEREMAPVIAKLRARLAGQ